MSLTQAEEIQKKWPQGQSEAIFGQHLEDLKRVTILKTFWYPEIVDALELSATEFFTKRKFSKENIQVLGVPGAKELPLAAKLVSKHSDIVIALGCVIRGDTPHFDFVCQAAIEGLLNVSIDKKIPLGMGVLTVDHLSQAQARKGKGHEAAQAAASMWLMRRLHAK